MPAVERMRRDMAPPGLSSVDVRRERVDHGVVDAAVEVAVDLDDEVASRGRASDAHGGADGLAARGHEADGLSGGHERGDVSRHRLTAIGLVADDDPRVERITNGLHDRRVGMSEDRAAVRHEHVDERAAVRRSKRGTVGIRHLEVTPGEGVDTERRRDAAQQSLAAPDTVRLRPPQSLLTPAPTEDMLNETSIQA